MLHLVNTFWIYIIPGMISVYNMVLIKTSMEAMPPDLEESAYLDGAGYLTRFFRIVLPFRSLSWLRLPYLRQWGIGMISLQPSFM